MPEHDSHEETDFELEPTEAGAGEEIILAKLEKAKKKLAVCEAERKEYLDGWQRAKADYVNARKDDDAVRARLTESVKEECFRDIIPILDSFAMAMGEHGWSDIEPHWRVGVEQICNQLTTMLANHDVEKVDPIGDEFDPHLHQAVALVDVLDEKDDHRVVEVLQSGYRRGERVIRPAHVKVGRYQKQK